MNLKGDFNPGTSYSVGDVVRFDNMAFVAKESMSGIYPTDTLRWDRLAQPMWDVVDLILDTKAAVIEEAEAVIDSRISEDAIVLNGTTDPTAQFVITVDDSGLTPDLSVDPLEEEAAT